MSDKNGRTYTGVQTGLVNLQFTCAITLTAQLHGPWEDKDRLLHYQVGIVARSNGTVVVNSLRTNAVERWVPTTAKYPAEHGALELQVEYMVVRNGGW
jgi:hypothetical protein